MKYRRICDDLGIVLTPAQDIACAFCERAGLRFCVEFGWQNAEAKAEMLRQTVH